MMEDRRSSVLRQASHPGQHRWAPLRRLLDGGTTHQVGEAGKLVGRIVAEEMRGRGLHPLEVQVVKPGPEPAHVLFDLRPVHQPFRSSPSVEG